MATEILRPNAAGDETTLTPNIGTNWGAVDEETTDENTTWVYNATTTYQRDLFNLPALSVGSESIASITIYFRIATPAANYTVYAKPSQKSGTTVTDGTEVSKTGVTTFETFSQTYTTNPATGVAYTWDEIDALQVGLQLKGNTPGQSYRCTQIYVEVDYTVATLMSAMLTLLGQDLDDDWSSTTTSAGNANKLTLEDTSLNEKVADWVSDGMIVYLPTGPTLAGNGAETRVVDSLSGTTLTVKNAFSAQVESGVTYVVHRLFTRSQKLVALRNSAALICPGIHAVVRDMETVETTDNKFEFDISSLLIYQNRPHQILLAQETIEDIWVAGKVYAEDDIVRPTSLSAFTGYTYICTTAGTSDSSEPTWPTTADSTVVDNTVTWTRQDDLDYSNYPMVPLHDWDVTPDGKLFLNSSYSSGYKIMIVGIKPLAFTGSGASETIALDSPFNLVLSAQAALYLFKQRANSAVGQSMEAAQQKVQSWTQELAIRKAQYWMKPPDGTLITGPGLSV